MKYQEYLLFSCPPCVEVGTSLGFGAASIVGGRLSGGR